MKIQEKRLTALLLMVCIVILAIALSTTAAADAPEPAILTSQGRTVYTMIKYTEGSEGIPVIKARLEQDLHAIENIFLHHILRNNDPYILFIRAVCTADGYSHSTTDEGNLKPAIATLSSTQAVTLINAHPLRTGPVGAITGIKDTANLGRAYLIDTTTDRLSFDDLLAFVLLFPNLSEQNPILAVDEEILMQIKNSSAFRDFSNIELELSHPGIWSMEGKSFSPIWRAGVLFYYIKDFEGNRLFELEPLEYYLAKPRWSPVMPRFIGGATEKELFLVDTYSAETHRLDLTELFPSKYLQMSDSIELAISPNGDRIYFTLSFNLPLEFWETDTHSYVYHLKDGRIKAALQADPVTPQATEPPADTDTDRWIGAIDEHAIDATPGYVSIVWQLKTQGWASARLSRHESFPAKHLSALLPEEDSLAFQTAGFLNQSRFIAFASQKEIVLYEITTQRYYRLNLKELQPADYKKISAIRFTQNPNSPENNIYFFLEKSSQAITAYIWDLSANKLEQLDKPLEQILREEWEFTHGTISFSLPPSTMILTESQARTAIVKEFSLHMVNVLGALVIWLGIFFVIFLVPFVLSNTAMNLAVLKLKDSRLSLGFAPAVTAFLFMGLSVIILLLILPDAWRIQYLVFPLPWFASGRSASYFFMFGFMIIVATVLTILAFRQSTLLWLLSQNRASSNVNQSLKSVTMSASLVYGFAGAILLILLFALVAIRLPYLMPTELETLLILAMFYALCLAAAYFLLKAPPAIAGYLTAAATFLGIGAFGYYSLSFFRAVSDYSLSEAVIILIQGDWLRNFALILPQVLICLVYLTRIWLEYRGKTLKMPIALITAALIAVPSTVIILYSERLDWYVPKLGYFALPTAFALIALTVVSLLSALVCIFRFSGQQPLLPAVPLSSLRPSQKKLRVPIGPIMAGIAGLLAILRLLMQAVKGIQFRAGLDLFFLLLLIYLVISSVFYIGRFLTVRLVKLLNGAEW